MILFTNLVDVKMDSKNYNPIPILKFTIENHFDSKQLNTTQKKNSEFLKKEAKTNNFNIRIT